MADEQENSLDREAVVQWLVFALPPDHRLST